MNKKGIGLCNKCGKNAKAKSAYSCNKCRNKANRQHYHKTINERREYRRKWRSSLRLDVLRKYGCKCECCGETEIQFLCIDHIHGGGCKHRKKIKESIYFWLRKNNYPYGYRVLCHNCNLSLGFYGTCPHNK